ncbi:BgTH12-01851 [Blumeria graminis f. sp. triticale]|uniref:BgtE-5658 n=3 Tax=Blumeria graminis TaxID=34373 RepID=A0A061HEG7_BLUGR|nr:putative secreted effector protein [Blumeria graminis f. sp. tritici 96224]CAD6501601.1 BgTH12-01851 [Blumeria graminis f. sp. triticale]VDB84153.1 BgtE-5658 [Blumeria graminis f. sp. tritici]
MKFLPVTPLFLLLSSFTSSIVHVVARVDPIDCAGFIYDEEHIANRYVKAKNAMANWETTTKPETANKRPFESYWQRAHRSREEREKYTSNAIIVPLHGRLHPGSEAFIVMDKPNSRWVAKNFVIYGKDKRFHDCLADYVTKDGKSIDGMARMIWFLENRE